MGKRNEYTTAIAKGRRMLATTPHAIAARYDRRTDRLIVTFNTGFDLSFSPRDAQGLENASPEQLNAIEITPPGFGLYWPHLDADLYLPAVLEGVLGSRRWMAARLGAAGGRSRSKTKVAASRENGRLGGRPAKEIRQSSAGTASIRRPKQKAPQATNRTRRQA